jgi:threonine aldolase
MIDLRSDTVTKPTPGMRAAMAAAEVGDDVYGDDPTVNALEAEAASQTGKAAAIFVPSGTMGNQIAVMTHCRRGDEVILDEQCHINIHEVGAAAVMSGVTLHTVPSYNGNMSMDGLDRAFRTPDIHYPEPRLLCLENAHSLGTVMSLLEMEQRHGWAKERGLAVHLDGARIFNAADCCRCEAAEIARYADSVMFCLSKGLCAPVGSMLCGDADFIARARRHRKLLGGGMRQAGVLAAAGLVALREMRGRLGEDHARARRLSSLLAGLPKLAVDGSRRDINMVWARVDCDGTALADFLRKRGILVNPPERGILRLVTHHDLSDADVETAAAAIRKFLS